MRQLMFASRWITIGSLISVVTIHTFAPPVMWVTWAWLVVNFTILTTATAIVVIRDVNRLKKEDHERRTRLER